MLPSAGLHPCVCQVELLLSGCYVDQRKGTLEVQGTGKMGRDKNRSSHTKAGRSGELHLCCLKITKALFSKHLVSLWPQITFPARSQIETKLKCCWVPGFAGWQSRSYCCKGHAGESAGTVTPPHRVPDSALPRPALPGDSRQRSLKIARLFSCRLVFDCCVTVSKQGCYIKAKRLFGKRAAGMRKGKLHTSAFQDIDVLVLRTNNTHQKTLLSYWSVAIKELNPVFVKDAEMKEWREGKDDRQTWWFWKWSLWRETCFSAAPHEKKWRSQCVLLAIYSEATFRDERLKKNLNVRGSGERWKITGAMGDKLIYFCL